MSRTSRAGALLLSFALLLVAATAAQAEPRKHRPGQSPAEVAKFWSKDRMVSAKPRERAKSGGGAARPSGFTSGAVPLPYTGATLTNGKVFFTENGVRYVCSGTSVTAPSGKSFVWTAGHCVNEGPGDFVTDWMFAPGYVDGTTPHGKWTADELVTTSQWQDAGDFSHDLGGASVVPGEGASGTLANITTPRPLQFGYSVLLGSTRFTSFGYPAAGKFNGQRLRFCDSAVQRRDAGDPQPMGIGCDMTGGSSGGGWVASTGAVGSVNSYGYSGLKNVMFGPFQGAVAQQLYASLG
jgi:V8-like Glu-specific endopeptidase